MKTRVFLLMKFLPIHFIVLFTLAGLALYHSFKNTRTKKLMLLVWGFLFAALYGSAKFALLTVLISAVVYGLAKWIEKTSGKGKRKIILFIGILLSLGFLSFYKYPVLKNHLPVPMQFTALGISYFTFKFIHVLIDTNRNRLKHLDFLSFMSFIFFFPTFSAGPIQRYGSFDKEITRKEGFFAFEKEDIDIGISRIIYGLFKKFIIADKTALLINKLAPDILHAPVHIIWLIVFLYSVKIYYDFSGYSDIAIGLGRLFGIKVPENFNKPYLKRNIVLFWQNWHMTLTSWLREYLFMPLGKMLMGKVGRGHPYFINTLCQLVTMTAVGIWHGSTFGFLVWGIYHGMGLAFYRVYSDLLNKYASEDVLKWLSDSRLAHALSIGFNFLFVSLGWVFFSFSYTRAIEIIRLMFNI